MKLRVIVGALCMLGVIAATSASCATGLIASDDDGGTSSGDGAADGGCPATCDGGCTDLKSDNANCGKCGNACAMGATCVQGSCQCGSTQTKCASKCVDTKTDTANCGGCNNACGADAGPISGGGTWGCANGTCAIQCPMGKTECTGACVDTKTDNDNCGTCGNPCAVATEQCMQGLCCKTTETVCSGADGGAAACTDTKADPQNCGVCGKVCQVSTPYCNAGTCIAGITYSESFTSGATPSTQCTNWNTFRTAFTGSYTSVTIKGSVDPVGVTCTGAQANQLCQALHNNATVNVGVCNGHTWATGQCGGGIELTDTGVICQCNTGYTIRPCIGNLNWGGVNGSTCSGASQTITVICQ